MKTRALVFSVISRKTVDEGDPQDQVVMAFDTLRWAVPLNERTKSCRGPCASKYSHNVRKTALEERVGFGGER